MEGAALPPVAWTFEAVQDRLVEAMLTCWRHPDRERGWQRVRSTWPEITRELGAGDYDARGGESTSSDVAIRPASLTRRDVREMEEAFGWMGAIAPDDRKIVGLAITQLARGRREVAWRVVLRSMGLRHGSDGMRMRYGRAIAAVADRLNGGNPRASVSTPEKCDA
ncbi:hypothetical protein CA223_06765 [Sphingomonas koreensis]|uniref:Uncharacterized protein n=1 Tax=Sphingomonas koreensis TaxID=93064 RepID=A0A1L6JG16_9SPHN|nr:hypothetical protein BRX40_05715 [Sphingomonas koreensis]RSU23054.1 hypothetical protein CA224_05335 [Sphingomonas koreensis]RSU30954.1 hypothetical protein CA222_01210 [Sphingomonas koreensis]RSU32256.1 hypothetical protein CA225_00290 [Sphingomonas koreensis]RSU39503.1 hypothetical protein BRX39_01240 [Sphingomonas koreensis]